MLTAVAALTLATSAAAAPESIAVDRALSDRPDDFSGPQIHLMYVLPSDGIDRELDLDGTIADTVAVAQEWLRGQTGGRGFRIDTAGGQPDITFFQMDQTDAEIAATGAFVRDTIEDALVAAGFDAPDKLYSVYYDGSSTWSCGGGAWPPQLPGTVAALYLNGFEGLPYACANNPFKKPGQQPWYWEFSFLHELVHTLGFVADCAPNETLSGHVDAPTNDLMYAGNEPWDLTDVVLDEGNDDYFNHDNAGCLDLADSAYLEGSASSGGSPAADFDGDGDSDVSVFRAGSQFGEWNVLGQPPFPRLWGAAGDVPVPANYDADPQTELAVFRRGGSAGEWYVEGMPALQWGAPADTPVPGDYDGDGDVEPAVFRQGATYGEWYVQGQPLKLWGAPGDVPVPGDYDGDGDSDLAVFRQGPTYGEWYVQGQPLILWGAPDDIPVPADYDGDGDTDIAVFRPGATYGEWYVRGGAPFVLWGSPTDLPMPGDYDGDGDTDIAVFRRGAQFGEWYVQGKPLQLWGARCDTPLPLPYHLLKLVPTSGC